MTLSSTAARLLAMVAPALMMGGSFGTGTVTGRTPSGPGTQVIDNMSEHLQRQIEKRDSRANRVRVVDATEARILRMLGGFNTGAPGGYRTGPGWSQAKVQRMARKKRNQARNKRAHLG